MYRPVNCEFYDQLNVIIQRQIPTTIIYIKKENDSEEFTAKDYIKSMTLENNEEFLVLKSNQKIRLDLVHFLNGKKYKKDEDE
ncbi:MAG: transcriptional antiterminator Rof [Campylobacteraceae bacterium]|nr:transcriptional antiterminator Rof [Campylobacteraceae bacterium]